MERDLVRYWLVSHDADTNETGYPMHRTYIKTIWQGFPAQQFAEREIVEDWCYSRFGNKTAYVQGVAATPNWVLGASTVDEYIKADPIWWGGWRNDTWRFALGIGKGENAINVLSEEHLPGGPPPP